MIWSKYTYSFSKEDRYYLYNSLSNSLAEISETVFKTVEKGRKTQNVELIDAELFEQFRAMKQLV